ncbi:MAG: glycosyltransferase family 2 protein [Pyrinomonadaceae bacterium]|nr:glycosyltransferase family 2 protein [Pyrinomonadaceae bacterium]
MTQISQQKPDNKLVSIIIPFLDREDFLAESIESVLAQTFENWELILVDDGSTDTSPDVARQYAEDHPEKIFIYSHENRQQRGASSSRNLGIKNAKGDFITFLDSDDVYYPQTLALEMAAFEKNPDAEVVCGSLRYWFSWTNARQGKEMDFDVSLRVQTEKPYDPPALFIHTLLAGGRKPGMASVILKSDFSKRFSLFEDDFEHVSEDQIFWAKVSLNSKIYLLDECLAKYRQHPDSSSAVLTKSGNMLSDLNMYLRWLDNYLKDTKIDNREIRKAVDIFKAENQYKTKYRRAMNFYRRMLPHYLRFRIRDAILWWRTRK